jgi:hypothetical protein
MMKFLGVLSAIAILSTSAHACNVTLDQIREKAASMVQSKQGTYREFADGDAKKIAVKVNEIPPQTDYQADVIGEVVQADGDVYIIVSQNSCLVTVLHPPIDAWNNLLSAALGKSS